MEQDKTVNPDAIVVFSAGWMPREEGGTRPTTYDEEDGFGTLGGEDRARAGAYLAEEYPGAVVVTTCKRIDDVQPTLAQTYAAALVALGVASERIVREETSVNTGTSIDEVLKLANEKGWQHIFFVSSGYQIPRIEAFYNDKKKEGDPTVTFLESESIIAERDPSFTSYFEEVKTRPEYAARLAAERRGIQAIKEGTYRPAKIDEKKERSSY